MESRNEFFNPSNGSTLSQLTAAGIGPGYQVTSQVNVVNPGGAAQTAHRDYHLGFQPDSVAGQFPAHVHRLSPVLTLQGAVAHSAIDWPRTMPALFCRMSAAFSAFFI